MGVCKQEGVHKHPGIWSKTFCMIDGKRSKTSLGMLVAADFQNDLATKQLLAKSASLSKWQFPCMGCHMYMSAPTMGQARIRRQSQDSEGDPRYVNFRDAVDITSRHPSAQCRHIQGYFRLDGSIPFAWY